MSGEIRQTAVVTTEEWRMRDLIGHDPFFGRAAEPGWHELADQPRALDAATAIVAEHAAVIEEHVVDLTQLQ